MTINLSRVPECMNPKFRNILWEESPLEVFVGGGGSSKSYSIAQKLIYKTILEKGHRWIAGRKVKKDVKHSVYDLLRLIISEWNFDDLFTYNNTESYIKCKINGNDIIGVGLDDVGKLKSIVNPSGFWIDEADQTTPDDVAQLRLRIRTPKKYKIKQQGILSMNPIWI